MKIELKFGPRFRDVFGAEAKQVEIKNGADMRKLLNKICDSDKRRIKLFGNTDSLRPSVLVTKNKRFIVHLDWLETKLEDGDEVEILSLMSGG